MEAARSFETGTHPTDSTLPRRTIRSNPHQKLLGRSNQEERDGKDRWHVWERGLGCRNQGGKKPLGRPRRRWNYNIKRGLRK